MGTWWALLPPDYGKMRWHEINAEKELFSEQTGYSDSEEEVFNARGKVIDLVLPVVILIVCCVLSLLYVGNILDGASFIDSFANTDATVGLPMGGLVALILTVLYLTLRKVVSFKEAMNALPKGLVAMVPAITILTMATALKNITGVLGAKFFVGNLMEFAAAGMSSFLPAIIFLVACILAFATGTSWGTFGILIPIVTSIFGSADPLLVVGMSACLAGAVCGDHCSPISDTTIMSSAGACCEHLDHVSTQLPYAISVAGISFVMYVFAGFVPNAFICLPVGVMLSVVFLVVMKAITKQKKDVKNNCFSS